MQKQMKHVGILAAVLALSLVAAACGGDETPGGGCDRSDRGPHRVDHDLRIVDRAADLVLRREIFSETNPDVAISVDGPAAGDGFELFCNSETDISDASRPIGPTVKACKQNGIEYTELEVALDGVTVMTNPENSSVSCLNGGDLYALFGPESDSFDSWAAADPLASEVGGTGGFPDAPLEITAPGGGVSTYDAFIELTGIEGHRSSSRVCPRTRRPRSARTTRRRRTIT